MGDRQRRNPLEFVAEYIQNLADPRRQQFQRAQQLQRQQALLEAQNQLTQASVLGQSRKDVAGITAAAARDKAKRESQADFGGRALDAMKLGADPEVVEQFLLRSGTPAEQIPRLPGLGPTRVDPTRLGLTPTAVQRSEMGLRGGQEALARAQGLTATPRPPVAGDFAPPGFQFTPQQATQAMGGLPKEFEPQEDQSLGFLKQYLAAIKAASDQDITINDVLGQRRTQTKGITDAGLQAMTRDLERRLGLTPTPARGPLSPEDEATLDSLLPDF